MVTDSFGRKIDFRNTIIILTSNVRCLKHQAPVFLRLSVQCRKTQADFDGMKEKILEEAKKQFKPEFLNRLDDVVVFHMLEKKALNVIVDLESKKLIDRLQEKGIAPQAWTNLLANFSWIKATILTTELVLCAEP